MKKKSRGHPMMNASLLFFFIGDVTREGALDVS